MSHHCVSVVIPTRNRAEQVVEAIRSAARHPSIIGEIVVVDDGSTDDTPTVLASMAVTVVRQNGGGVSSARNAGLDIATGEWITFLDDDDRLTESWGDTVRPFLTDKQLGLVCGGYVSDQDPSTVFGPQPLGPQYRDIVGGSLAGTWLARRSQLQAIGGYATALRHSENVELFLRLTDQLAHDDLRSAATGDPFVVIGSTIAGAQRGSTNNRAKIDATAYLLRHREQQLARQPDGLAALARAGAVASARVGELRQARTWFRIAARSGRNPFADRGRALLTYVPSVARRVWGGDRR